MRDYCDVLKYYLYFRSEATASAEGDTSTSSVAPEQTGLHPQQQSQQSQPQLQQQSHAPHGIPPTSQPMQFSFNPALLAAQNHLILQDPNSAPVPQMTMPPHTAAAYFNAAAAAAVAVSATPQFVPPPPPPTTTVAAMLMPMQGVTVAPPPPPPPPQLPLSLASLTPLYMIPAPEPLQLNAIPQPKDFDLSAIPKPQLNLEAIQMPANNVQDTNLSVRPSDMTTQHHLEPDQQQQNQQQIQQEREQIQQQQMQQQQMQQQQMQQQQMKQQPMQQQPMQHQLQQQQHQQMQHPQHQQVHIQQHHQDFQSSSQGERLTYKLYPLPLNVFN